MNTSLIKQANAFIADACLIEYRKANTLKNGRMRAKHVPYCVPDWCEALLKIISHGTEIELKTAMVAVRAGCYTLV